MGVEATPDFSGYATKAGLKCSDGRIIMPDAFKHQDRTTVPLVWQHNHNEPSNVLGYATLENREDGVYAYGFFNGTDGAKNARTLVEHGDIKSLSIYANQLTEKSKQVLHGFIRELSLVLSGANPGALIDNITLAHADGEMVTLDDEAIIYTGLELNHADGQSSDSTDTSTGDSNEPTVQEVYDSLTEEQKNVVHYMIGAALESSNKSLSEAAHSDGESTDKSTDKSTDESTDKFTDNSVDKTASELVHHDGNNEKEGRRMSRNVFEEQSEGKTTQKKPTLTHDAMREIVADAQKSGSLKDAVEAYALKHGIDNIELLFPDARSVTDTPEFDQRRIEWVSGVINSTKHSPFSRIKSLVADITVEEARAMGYVKGNLKKEEFFGLTKRVTTPSIVYKKQQLDRDDIVDITDFDVVAWLKAEMRLMLDEELARAVLIGDGRAVDNEDKIKDPAGAPEGAGIRSILHDHDLYAAKVDVNLEDAGSNSSEMVDAILTHMGEYKGSGQPTFYTTLPTVTRLLLAKDSLGRRLYRTTGDLAAELGVASVQTVE